MKTKPSISAAPWLAALVGLALAVAPARAQEPGRIEIKGLDKLAEKADEVADVTLDGRMLAFASGFLEKDDPEEAGVKDLLKNLKGVYVKSFEFDKEGQYSPEDVEAIRAQLRSPAWSRIVGVRSKRDKENAEIYVMGEDKNIKGMVIIAFEPKELTVVNIVGPIDLDTLSGLEGHMGIPPVKVEKGAKPVKEEGSHEKKN